MKNSMLILSFVLSFLISEKLKADSRDQFRSISCKIQSDSIDNKFYIEGVYQLTTENSVQLEAHLKIQRAGRDSEQINLGTLNLLGSVKVFPAGYYGAHEVTFLKFKNETDNDLSMKLIFGLNGNQSTLNYNGVLYKSECKQVL